jgi:FkbM family methyltransferase
MKKFIKEIVNWLGYEIKKKSQNFFLKNRIDLIIDVGAHKGEFSKDVLSENYDGKIISFEPQLKIYNILLNNSKKYKNWIIHERCGIGSRKEDLMINVMSETTCSSYLEPNIKLLSIDPSSKVIKKENTKIETLNYLFSNKYKLKKNTFLKIDTQGYDKFVLKGASSILKKILFVQLELSIDPLYVNETNYEDMIKYMRKEGFIIWKIGGVIENLKGKTMAFDIVFKNSHY